jgi:ABC-type sugar transport system, periplasmic component
MKKTLVFIIGFALFVTMFSGCGQSQQNNESTVAVSSKQASAGETTAENKEPVKLRFFITDATDKQQIDDGLPDFNKLYPNIQVETVSVSGENAAQQINTAILGGEQLDVLYSSYTYFLGSAPKLYLPLNDLLKKDNFDVSANFGNYIDFSTIDGVVYGFPKELAPAGIFYNSKHFKDLNLTEPTPDWTWDDFFSLAGKLKVMENNKVKRYGAFDWDPAMGFVSSAMYSGWEIVTSDGKPNFTDPRFKKMFEMYYKAMVIDKSMPTPAETATNKYNFIVDLFKGKWSLLITGRNAALFLDLHRMVGNVTPEDDDAGIFKMAYMPKWDASSKAKMAYDIPVLLAVSKSTKYSEEAYQLLKWTCTNLYEISAKTTHQVPSWKLSDIGKIADSWSYYMDNDKNIVKGKDRAEMYKMVLDPDISAIIPANTLKYPISAKYNDVANKYGSLVLNGQMPVDEAIQKMQKEAEDILAKNN